MGKRSAGLSGQGEKYVRRLAPASRTSFGEGTGPARIAQATLLLAALGLVALYLLVYYRALGLVVVVGLGVWSALMYGTICWFSIAKCC